MDWAGVTSQTVEPRSRASSKPKKRKRSKKSNKVLVENLQTHKRGIGHVVLDAGALMVKEAFFNSLGQNVRYYMTEQTHSEVRDRASRYLLDNFPYKITIRDPDETSLGFVRRWISRNPDLRSLSVPDRGLIALTYMIEKEINGTANIKQQQQVKRSSLIPKHEEAKTRDLSAPAGPSSSHQDVGFRLCEEKPLVQFHLNDFFTLDQSDYQARHGAPPPTMTDEQLHEASVAEQAQRKLEQVDIGDLMLSEMTGETTEPRDEPSSEAKKPDSKKNAFDAWNGDWLTPDNFKPVPKRRKNKGVRAKDKTDTKSSVACITSDLTMQKCMVEMGLRVMSVTADRQLTESHMGKFIFRCYACFQFETNTGLVYCKWCGSKTFQRVQVFVDENGKMKYHYFYRDRYASKFMERRNLIPRGGQLVKYVSKKQKRERAKKRQRNKKRGNLSKS